MRGTWPPVKRARVSEACPAFGRVGCGGGSPKSVYLCFSRSVHIQGDGAGRRRAKPRVCVCPEGAPSPAAADLTPVTRTGTRGTTRAGGCCVCSGVEAGKSLVTGVVSNRSPSRPRAACVFSLRPWQGRVSIPSFHGDAGLALRCTLLTNASRNVSQMSDAGYWSSHVLQTRR